MSLDSSQLLTMGELLWKQAEQNSEDFAIALSLAESYGRYLDTLIQDFAIAINDELRRKLEEKQEEGLLQGFTVTADSTIREHVLEKDIAIFGLLNYEKDIYSLLSSEKHYMARNFWGCWVGNKGKADFDIGGAQAELNTVLGSGKVHQLYIWWNWFGDSDAKNWKAPRALDCMAKAIRRQGPDKDTSFLDIFVEPLVKTALIAEKHMKK